MRFGGPGSNCGFGVTGSLLVSPDQSVSLMPFFTTAAVNILATIPALALIDRAASRCWSRARPAWR